MRIDEISNIINEVRVKSSWIDDIEYKNGVTYMTLLNGRKYRILGLTSQQYIDWLRSPSKGKWWHDNVRGIYRTTRA